MLIGSEIQLKRLIYTLLLILVAACQPQADHPTQQPTLISTNSDAAAQTTSPNPSETLTNDASSTNSGYLTPTMIPTPSIRDDILSSLPPGLYFTVIRGWDGLFIYSLQGEELGQIAAGLVQFPALSPDHERLAYFSWAGFCIHEFGEGDTCIQDGVDRLEPSWAPTSDRLAVLAIDEANDAFLPRIRIIDVSSMTEQVVDFSYPGQHDPDWSPTNDYIAFYLDTPDYQASNMYLLDTTCLEDIEECTTSLIGPLDPDDYVFTQPSWSPDGSKIAMGCFRTQDSEVVFNGLCVMNIIDRSFITLPEIAEYAGNPQWSPDYDWIAFTNNVDEIYIIRPDGTEGQLLYKGGEFGFWLLIE